MGTTPIELLLTLLAYDDSRGAPLSNAPYSAYQRLEAGGGVLIMDTGRAPPPETSLDAHAGCLAFEFSSPQQSLIVVNCGMPATAREEWRSLARTTAAHSTVTFNDKSSAYFAKAQCLQARARRLADDRRPAHGVRFARRGFRCDHAARHARRLRGPPTAFCMSAPSRLLRTARASKARICSSPPMAARRSAGTQDRYAVRFHLHPSIKASRLTDSQGVLLMMPNREVWTFSAGEGRVQLEDSVYLSGNEGPRRTAQIVIHGEARSAPRVTW